MFKPCPNCGFLVALIAGREASQRCPRCGSAMLEDGELPPAEPAQARRASGDRAEVGAGGTAAQAHADTSASPDDGAMAGEPGAPADPGTATRTDATAGAFGGTSDDTPAAMAPGQIDTPAVEHAAPASPAIAPSFTTRRHRVRARRHGRRWPWAVGLPLLALLLALQLLLSQRVELAQDATWRPVVGTVCGVLGCELPPWREPAAFSMLARNVRPHATRDGVLHVTTSLRNDAAWPQPVPTVVLSLSDLDGRVLAARAVPPVDYGRPPTTLVAPGDSIDIAFDVREPSPRVVSFDFQLR